MRQWSLIATVATLLATALTLLRTDMFGAGSVATTKRDHPVCVVLTDGTRDALPEVATQGYQLLAQCIDQVSNRGGTIVADVIHADGQSTTDFSYTYGFAPSQAATGSGNPQAVTDDLARQAAEARRDLPNAFNKSRAASGSDFVGALMVTGDRLSQPDLRDRPRTIVVVGNLLQNTPELRFLTTALTDEWIDRTIAGLRREGRLARLQGVHVVFVGAGLVRSKRPPGPKQQIGLRRFFARYIEESGGKVILWAPSLITIPTIG